MNESFGKIDIIIIIILALLVAFIIGFNIIQIIDKKLNSVIINVPPQNCTLPQILVNFDKDNKPIKLNQEQINLLNNKVNHEENNKEEFNNINNSYNSYNSYDSYDSYNSNDNTNYVNPINQNYDDLDQTVNTTDSDSHSDSYSHSVSNYDNEIKEHYGSLPDKYDHRDDIHTNVFAQRIGSSEGNDILNNSNRINPQDPNYNTIDNYPFLVDPTDASKGYYESRVKLISDSSSPLLKLERKNMDKINQVINSCIKNQPIQEMDATYDGYNKYPTLQSGSFANFTSIGKSLLTPYTSYPVPS